MERDRDTGGSDDVRCSQDVVNMPMHTAIRDQTHQMRRAASLFQPRDEVLQRSVGAKAALFNRKVNLTKIHRNDTARANIGMANLRIAHLPGRQTDIRAVGYQMR